jgi:hypothetical protein
MFIFEGAWHLATHQIKQLRRFDFMQFIPYQGGCDV